MNHRTAQHHYQMGHRHLAWWALALPLLALLLNACGGSTDTAPDAKSLIQAAQAALQADSGYHFKLKLDHAGTGGAAGYVITGAEGDVARPDKVQGTGTVQLGGASIAAQYIGIGKNQWVLAPPAVNDWTTTEQLKQELNIDLGGVLSDPTGAVLQVLAAMQNPKNKGDDSIPNDGDCWVVQGTVPAGALASITGGDPTSTTPLDTTICVSKKQESGSKRQLFELVLKGIATDGDLAQTTRTFTFTKFNVVVNIQPPPGVTVP
jgi:hypothetical protein